MSTLTDPYQTRAGGSVQLLERQDPVLHGRRGASPDGVVSATEVEKYERDGYLFLPSFFQGEELKGLAEERDRLLADKSLAGRPEVIVEPESRAIRSVFAVHQLSTAYALLAAHPRLMDIARHLLGSEVYIHQSRINYKPGFVGKEFYWHSDFETWHSEDGMPRMRAVSCSISLTENTEHNGPLMVMPGSHRTFVSCPGETPQDNFKQSLRRQEAGTPDPASLEKLANEGGIVSATGPAGSVTFFECNLMHGSSSNISPWPRSNIFFVFNSVENQLRDPFCGRPARPDYIASR